MKRNNYFYLGLIFVIWLLTYIACTVLWEQKLGWDEVNYLGVAKGIAEDGDWSGRFYTIMGILKYGYPTHFINFPIFSIYIALFLKLFGANLHVAYFSTWLACLGTCILIYFIFLLISENSKKAAFITSLAYLFSPGIIKNCDSALMEQFGCFLLCLFTYIILKDYQKGKFTFLTAFKFTLAFLILWLYKSLLIGFFAGSFIFICLAYNEKFTDRKIKTSVPLPVFLIITYGMFIVLFYLIEKYVFLPVASMMNFSKEQEFSQVYADFLGGFFNNFSENLITNLNSFLHGILLPHFSYPNKFSHAGSFIFVNPAAYIFVGQYFFLLLLMMILTFSAWKKLSSISKLFICLTLGTIISFNLVFNVLFYTSHGNIYRYNVYSLPLYLCCLVFILKLNIEYLKPFQDKHPRVSKALLALFLLCWYLPLFVSLITNNLYLENMYHEVARINTSVVKNSVGASSPKFIYYNDGTHLTWDLYPAKQVMKDATNEQLLKVNRILPEPIEFLFIMASDWLFQNNKDLIIMGAPILDNKYVLHGFEKETQTVVYRLKKDT